jgi:hypothetical protein
MLSHVQHTPDMLPYDDPFDDLKHEFDENNVMTSKP